MGPPAPEVPESFTGRFGLAKAITAALDAGCAGAAITQDAVTVEEMA